MGNTEQRTQFEWSIFALIHIILIGGIIAAGFYTYGWGLGVWVAAQGAIAGLALTYLFARDVPGETLMKVLVYGAEVLNVSYLIHNGAKRVGVELFNAAQVEKYEAGMSAAAQSATRGIAKTLGAHAKDATELAKMFDDGTTIIASALAGVSLFVALVVLSIASRRRPSPVVPIPSSNGFPSEIAAEETNGESSSNSKTHR